MRAICLDRETGKVLHDIELMTEHQPEPIHTLNSFASPSPIAETGRVYCHFGPNGTACVDTESGQVLWANQSDELRVKTENGAGSTPVLWNNFLIVHFDGSDRQFIAALDKYTGQIVWRTSRSGKMNDNPQLKKSYGTPLVVPVDGQPVIMSPASDWLYAYEPETGRELWKLPYEKLGFSVVPKPVEKDGVLYFCTCFMQSEMLAVRFAKNGSAVDPAIVWRYSSQVSQMPSPLMVDDLLYFVADKGGVVTCVDATHGELVWRERLGGNYSASPIHAAGRIYFFDREGTTHVIKPGRQFTLLAENHLEGSVMASAALVDEAMFVRTDKAMYRIQER
jgi:outer membrane protein assembly factor BamB